MDLRRELTQLYPGVWRLIAPNASAMTGPGTNTYLVGQKRLIIIDPGPQSQSHAENIRKAVERLNSDVEAVVITHAHSDHSGGAEELASQLSTPLLGFGRPLEHGTRLEIDGTTLVAHHTPGHMQAHIALWLVEQKLLFAGDLVAGHSTVLIVPPDGDMAAYLDSLKAMMILAPSAILPGHGPIIDDPQARLESYLDHRLRREAQIVDLLAEGLATAEEIAARLYTDRPEVMRVAVLQVEAHLAKLRKEGRI